MHRAAPLPPPFAGARTGEEHEDDDRLAAVSRELKHPLNVISAHAQLLAALPEVQRLPEVMRAARAIQREAMNQGRILESLLDHAPESPAAGDDARETPDLRGIRVLLVDDSADALETFAFLLAHDGFVVKTAESGADALVLADAEPFDVLVSDVGMPRMDGYALLRELRSRPSGATLPAIALTGYGRQQDIDRAIEAGFHAHLDKPADVERLKRLIADVLHAVGPAPTD